jgi:hypothetical protein
MVGHEHKSIYRSTEPVASLSQGLAISSDPLPYAAIQNILTRSNSQIKM